MRGAPLALQEVVWSLEVTRKREGFAADIKGSRFNLARSSEAEAFVLVLTGARRGAARGL